MINITNFNISYEKLCANNDFRDLIIKEYKLYDVTEQQNNFCISIYEQYYECKSLKEFLKDDLTTNDINNLLFQVMFSHAYLNYKLGNFRHN